LVNRYFIQLSFKGTTFNGWQKQKNAPSVHETLENSLKILLKQNIDLTGAGRTDTGVHAKYYIAHFDSTSKIINISDFIYHLNKILPYEIAVQNIFSVKPNAHARFDAILRTYEYVCVIEKDPFEKEISLLLKALPNVEAMNKACELLLQYSDFTSFCKLHSDNKTNICKVQEAIWVVDNNKLVFTITADRFLRNMVRAIVGTLLQVGYGKLAIGDFEQIIKNKNRMAAGTSAPAHGLYLIAIKYPQEIWCL